jgi:hypothetical protein
MRILFIFNPIGPDYLSDSIFHGGKSLFNIDLYETKRLWYMYDDIQNKEKLYGRGFTLFGKIPAKSYNQLPDKVENLIESKFFDKVIYGSVWRCMDYIDLVSKVYQKKDIIALDGEDHSDIKNDILDKVTYFKREYYTKTDGVYPISFSIPEELVLPKLTEKTKLISDIIPNFNWTYTFNNEQDYYNEYATSFFGITFKKSGWDCLRHYEIMMNGCVPLFKDLDQCPELICTTLPKLKLINMSQTKTECIEDNEFILDYTRTNLTTKHSILKIFN